MLAQRLPRALLRGAGAAARQQGVLARSARRCSSATRGPATSASSRAPCRARRCRRRGECIRASDIEFLHATRAAGAAAPAIALPSLAEAERAHIVRVLEAVQWNKKEAARVLEISRGTLYRKIVEYSLEPESRPAGARRSRKKTSESFQGAYGTLELGRRACTPSCGHHDQPDGLALSRRSPCSVCVSADRLRASR